MFYQITWRVYTGKHTCTKPKSADTSSVISRIKFRYFTVIWKRQFVSTGLYRTFSPITTNLKHFFRSTLYFISKHKKTHLQKSNFPPLLLISISSSKAVHSVWDFWWTNWHWDRFIFDYWGPVGIILPVLYNHSIIYHLTLYNLKKWHRLEQARTVSSERREPKYKLLTKSLTYFDPS